LIGRQQRKIPSRYVIVCPEIGERPGRRIEQARTEFDEDDMEISRPAGHQTLQGSKPLGRVSN
jgi:hypothetical protein